jgi:Fur family ferric uptake transcriptional regulator
MTYRSVYDKLEKAEYKITQQRKAVLDVMQESQGQHLSADDVLLAARAKTPNIGIATVYRTLERLAGIGVLYKTTFDEGKYRYELCTEESHQHHHIICLLCGRIFEVEEGLLNSLEKTLENEGFEIIDHQLKVYAYCADCKKTKK